MTVQTLNLSRQLELEPTERTDEAVANVGRRGAVLRNPKVI